jgi:hypothetical protein
LNNHSKSTTDEDGDDTSLSLDAWIEKVKVNAAALEEPLIQPTHLNFDEPDSEVTEVIKQMEDLLSHGVQNDDQGIVEESNDDFFEFDYTGFDFPALEIEAKANKDLSSDFLDHQLLSTTNRQLQMAELFCKSREEKLARKCLRCLATHCRREKKRLSRTAAIVQKRRRGYVLGKCFLLWKDICRVVKIKQTVLVIKFGRVASKQFRHAFGAWKKIASEQSELVRQAVEKLEGKVLCRVFSEWRHLLQDIKEKNTVSAFVCLLINRISMQ